jgi:MFS family permease
MTAANAAILDSRYSWTRLALSLAFGTVAGVGTWSVVLILPAIEAEFGTDRATASMAYTATMFGFAFGNFYIGRLIDRLGATAVLLGAALLLSSGYALSAAAGGIWSLSLAQGVLIGTGAAAGFGPLMADISHWFMRHRGIAVSIAASSSYTAGAVWPMLLQGPLETWGWRATHLGLAAIVLAALVPLAFALRRRLPAGAMQATLARSGGARRQTSLSPFALTLLLGIAGVACCTAMAMPQVHIVAMCADLGYGLAAGAGMLSVMLAAGIVSRVASGFVADRIGGIPTVLAGSFLQGVALILYIPFDGLASLYAVSLVFGLAQGGIVPGYAIIIREYLAPEQAGRRVGIVIMLTVLGMALGGWMSGEIFDRTGSYTWAFVNGVAWNVLNLAVILVILLRSGGGRQRAALAQPA